jgi:hypothetical protein
LHSDLLGALPGPADAGTVGPDDFLSRDLSSVHVDGSHVYRFCRPDQPAKCGHGFRMLGEDADRLRANVQWLIDQGYLSG